jgi:hypothetical protein
VTRYTIEFEGKVYADVLREAEAAKVAKICDRLIGNVLVKRADQSCSPLRPGDIALLSPSHTDPWRYERALRGKSPTSRAQSDISMRATVPISPFTTASSRFCFRSHFFPHKLTNYRKQLRRGMMRVVTIERMTMEEAERAIATLWCMLEKHGVPTPTLRVSRVAGAVQVTIEFQSELDASLTQSLPAS